jgi:molecular chaperone DnaK (HSP70)
MTAEPRYVIGLDIGDGESCLAWASLDRSDPAQIYTRRSGERSIVTAMAQSPSGLLIGDEAVISREATRFSVNFKDAGTPDAADFAAALLAEFRDRHPEVLPSATVFVGHPAGWSSEAVAAYEGHLGRLGRPVRLMPESQSALLHVRDRGRDAEQLERVLVVDIGSSTTDFTIVEDLAPRNLPVGAALGCRRIDEQLAGLVRDALHHDMALMAALAADGGPELLLLACRWAKEAQFSGHSRRIMDLRESCEGRFGPIVATAWTWLLDLEIPPIVAAPGGWGDDFRAVLAELADQQPNLVVLTGGGSRMPLAARLCREMFPAAEVEQDDDPAFAVVRGLVSNGRHQAAVDRFRREVTELIRAPETEAKVRAEAVVALGTMKDRVAAQMLEARGSAADLANHIKFGLYESRRTLEESLEYYLTMRLERICRRYDVPRHRIGRIELTLPDIFQGQLPRILESVGNARQFTGHVMPAELVQFGVDQLHGTAQNILSSALDRVRRRFAPGVTPEIVAALGALASAGPGLTADHAAQAKIQRILRVRKYTPEELDEITAQVLTTITEQAGRHARERERWLAGPSGHLS